MILQLSCHQLSSSILSLSDLVLKVSFLKDPLLHSMDIVKNSKFQKFWRKKKKKNKKKKKTIIKETFTVLLTNPRNPFYWFLHLHCILSFFFFFLILYQFLMPVGYINHSHSACWQQWETLLLLWFYYHLVLHFFLFVFFLVFCFFFLWHGVRF